MNKTVVKTIDLTKKIGTTLVLDNINLEIRQGEIYGLIGRNGAGKTTLLRLLTGLFKETSGSISLFGKMLSDDMLSRTASIINLPVAYEELSASDNLKYYYIEQGILDKNRIQEVLQIVNLTDTGKKKVKHFSLGMRQRLGIAMALLNRPDFLILDEPTNGLDPIAIIELRELLVKLNREYNMTMLISSHILTEVHQIATCFGFIDNGRIIEEISKKDFDGKCQESISFVVDDTNKAGIIITEQFSKSVKVIGANEIRVFGTDKTLGADINIALVENKIRVEEMRILSADLEEYFGELIKQD